MKKVVLMVLIFVLSGCVARVTPRGTFIEPLFPPILIGPPVIVAPPHGVVVNPLPPVAIVPDRSVYYYNDLYYYHWNSGWYWSRERRGPWHVLPRDRWPSRMEHREHGEHERRGPYREREYEPD